MVGYLSRRFTSTEAVDACLPCGVKIIQALNNARIANFCRQILIALICCMCKALSFYLKDNNTNTTLCGGSFGSRVDEERSKLRELM